MYSKRKRQTERKRRAERKRQAERSIAQLLFTPIPLLFLLFVLKILRLKTSWTNRLLILACIVGAIWLISEL